MQIDTFYKVIFLFLIILLVPVHSDASMVAKQGVGQVIYEGWGGPSVKVKHQAIAKAKLNALNNFVGSFDTAKMLNYEKVRNEIESNIDHYIINCKIVDDRTDKNAKMYRVVVEATINISLIEVVVQKASAVQQVSSDNRSLIGAVFVARQVTARKSFNARVTTVTDDAQTERETEQSDTRSNKTKFSNEYHKTAVKKNGGSVLQKSDQVEYDVSSSESINNAMSAVFDDAGYQIVEAEYLEDESGGLINVQDFITDYKFGNDISGKTRRNAVKGCRKVGVSFFAIGTLDIGAKDIDPVCGLTRVSVVVNGKILDLRKRFPRTIASVGPVQYYGLGSDQRGANINALKHAGEKAAETLVAKLRARNIQ